MRGEESSDSESGRMEESSIRRSLETLCQELNMDEQTATEAMENFTAIWNTYTLEGEVVHWLACSLYAACRKGSTPTVGKGLMEGNCVSLTRILRTAKLSLIQFFSKMRKWADMSNLSQDFRQHMERLERNFEVSTVIFRKFEPIFMDMFQNPQGGEPRNSEVFKFCWTLFVYTKGNVRMIGDDLVNSNHLLLCCLDLVFGNALLCANRKDLINPTFRGLPALYRADGHVSADEPPPCVLERLCELHDGLVVEAKGIKQHYFKPFIQKLYQKQILKGSEEHLTELLDPQNFIDNNKAINREYEEYVLTVGDFDERVFLEADADEEIGTPRKSASLAPSTPLTGRVYLKEKDLLVTPVSSATQSVSRLQSMVAGLRTSPSDHLMQIFKSCSRDPSDNILTRVKTLGQVFKEHYTRDSEETPDSHIDFAENRLKLAEILYYKILENAINQETKRLHGKDMSMLLEQDIFHCSLMACCLEVVLFSCSSQRTFPWIINIFKLSPFYFYKVIEVFICSEEGLSRDMVKHLIQIEEQILESKAWSADSALWSALQDAGNEVPTGEEVNFFSSLDTGSGVLQRRFGDDTPATGVVLMSAMAKKLIFSQTSTPRIGTQGSPATVLSSPPEASTSNDQTINAQFLLASPHRTASPSRVTSAPTTSDPPSGSRQPQRTRSLTLFFRKVYHLASVRLSDLCGKLDIQSELRGKIWTCFEHTLVHSTDLMKGRHLDQLLLCSVYIISKVTKERLTFHNIMKCYRSQPQASSHVYRSVLLRHTPREQVADENMEVDPVSGGESAGKSNQVSGEANSNQSAEEERGNLIQFYNSVFARKVKSFAQRYATKANRTYLDYIRFRIRPIPSRLQLPSKSIARSKRNHLGQVLPLSSHPGSVNKAPPDRPEQDPSTSESNLAVSEDIREESKEDEEDLPCPDDPERSNQQHQLLCGEAQSTNDQQHFQPELLTESGKSSYRFRCPGRGVFQCESTGLVFVMVQKVELLYRTVQWDESLLRSAGKMAAGLLFDIKCSEDSAVCQLHLPHCEVMDAPLPEGLLSVVHITDDGMNFLEPLEITDTHVVVKVSHLSVFGIVRKFFKSLLNSINMRPVSGQVLLFLGQPNPKTKRQKLNLFLLPRNIHLDEVSTQQRHSENIQVPSSCKLIEDQSYTLHCPQAMKIQPTSADFNMEFGPNYFPTFEVRLPTTTEEVTLTVKDRGQLVVWEHDVDLSDSSRRTAQMNVPADEDVPAEQKLSSIRSQFVERVSGSVLNQLLDKLLDLDVINDEEMQSVKTKPTTQDKARKLIDTVRKKGTEASSVLIVVLRKADPSLSSQLKLS